MLDSVTKRRIDTARDILVGKIPDPKSQVEQITIALIYKFMDDMDKESADLGGRRHFFIGELEIYSWTRLMSAETGGHQLLKLYTEAIEKFQTSQNLPQLFRDIFKNAFLPYRDPETLRLFLKTINDFTYEHSERLGDAFEYLLSVLGSQGDAGQFRTPRHIIDFIVECVDPQKEDRILDPACGTAGFLISAYKHILAQNAKDGKDGGKLTPDQKKNLLHNMVGYDISPDMVRLSRVNMYLHGFPTPQIAEYDTLTSEDKWAEYYDVILANPPFMSPKGGIIPHQHFSVQAKRSEVLFVDYIAEHLLQNGRAGVIVPEGIIFQSGNAYKSLRKMLVDNNLYAVVSLPAGVFQPYSGVKTSVLLMDKRLAKMTNFIMFVKVQAVGLDLGASRKPIDKNDIPEALRSVKQFKLCIERNLAYTESPMSFSVKKTEISHDSDYNLSMERYRKEQICSSRWPLVKFSELIEERNFRLKGKVLPIWSVTNNDGFVKSEDYFDKKIASENTENYKIISPKYFAYNPSRINVGSIAFNSTVEDGAVSPMYVVFELISQDIIPVYLFKMLKSEYFNQIIASNAQGAVRQQLRFNDLSSLKIPLPPLPTQKEIVAEIESSQKIIDGARQVVENYKPQIKIDPSWPMVELGEICTIVRGSSPRPQGDPKLFGGPVPRLMVADITRDGMFSTPQIDSLTEEGAKKSRPMKKGDVIITVSGNPGLPTILAIDACIHDGFVGLRELRKDVSPIYLYFALLALHTQHGSQSVGAVFKNLTTDQISRFKIAHPSLATQQIIVAQIEKEQALVNSNKQLIAIYEQKIKDKIAEVWGAAE